jgi:hypothetical protein
MTLFERLAEIERVAAAYYRSARGSVPPGGQR